MTTATKPTVNIERGLRQYIRANSNNTRVVLRIDWRTGEIDIYGRHRTDWTSYTQAEHDNKILCWYMDNRLTNRQLRELAESLTDLIGDVRAGYVEALNFDQTRMVGKMNEASRDAALCIIDRLMQINNKKVLGEI
jgi:hypothetical protein